jgi:hypothetical protein
MGVETAIVRFSLVRRFRAGFQFLENGNDLAFRETGLAHADSFRGPEPQIPHLRGYRHMWSHCGPQAHDYVA